MLNRRLHRGMNTRREGTTQNHPKGCLQYLAWTRMLTLGSIMPKSQSESWVEPYFGWPCVTISQNNDGSPWIDQPSVELSVYLFRWGPSSNDVKQHLLLGYFYWTFYSLSFLLKFFDFPRVNNYFIFFNVINVPCTHNFFFLTFL